MDFDKDSIISSLENKISDDLEKEIIEKLSSLDEGINSIITLPETYDLNIADIDNAIDQYFKDYDFDSDDYHADRSLGSYISEIEAIFER
ncbi:hypothetical protein [Paenibacillus sp. FSL E2-0201]|uniref:hypothetical protein n=1 Tax=Paenibacillus sp. FSL E2-0201 TaxID=2954726 RepID=UPI0030DD4959